MGEEGKRGWGRKVRQKVRHGRDWSAVSRRGRRSKSGGQGGAEEERAGKGGLKEGEIGVEARRSCLREVAAGSGQ